jgi:hypothetical protein
MGVVLLYLFGDMVVTVDFARDSGKWVWTMHTDAREAKEKDK